MPNTGWPDVLLQEGQSFFWNSSFLSFFVLLRPFFSFFFILGLWVPEVIHWNLSIFILICPVFVFFLFVLFWLVLSFFCRFKSFFDLLVCFYITILDQWSNIMIKKHNSKNECWCPGRPTSRLLRTDLSLKDIDLYFLVKLRTYTYVYLHLGLQFSKMC